MGPADDAEEPVRRFVTRFDDGSFADAAELLTEDGRAAVVESFPGEFQEGPMDAEAALEEYWRGLHGKYGDFEGVGEVDVNGTEATVPLEFEAGGEKPHRLPVSITEFESGDLPESPSVPEQVTAFLYRQQDTAFTWAEIVAAIDEDPNTVGTALTRLKERDLVRHRGQYWTITKDEQRVAAAYDLHSVSERLDGVDSGSDSEDWDTIASDRPLPSEQNLSEDG